MKKSKKLLSFLLTMSIFFSPALGTDAKAAPASLTVQGCSALYYINHAETNTQIVMEEGQKIEVRNLVFAKTGDEDKPLDYCKSSSGFKAKSTNSKVASIKKGVITARKKGKTKIIVTKNGKTFTISITVKEAKYTLTSEYAAANNYLKTLSKKYPNEDSIKKQGSTLIKSIAKLSRKINTYAEKIRVEEGIVSYENEESFIPTDVPPEISLSGAFSDIANYYLCLENPREYFRLAEMADKYIEEQAAKAKDLRFKSVKVSPLGDEYYNITIKLKQPLSLRQAMGTDTLYNPFTAEGNLPIEKSWKTGYKVHYYGKLYRITSKGNEREVDELVIIDGMYNEDVLEVDWLRIKKPATYKLYFNAEGASDPKKYCVTFKLDESMIR